VARTKAVELQDRNLRIAQMVSEGYGLQVIADHFGITRARVSQINSEYQSVISDDGTRDVLIAQLDSYLSDTLNPIIRGPGQPLYASGSGKLVLDPEGGIIYDEHIKIDAVNSALRVIERRAKLSALDRAKAKEKDESKEIGEALAYLETLASEKQALEARLAQYEQQLPELREVEP
jgi:hypothetical protein